MTEPTVKLPEDAWQRVLQILSTAPWTAANPLIMAIGGQLAAQSPAHGLGDGEAAAGAVNVASNLRQ